MPKRRSNSASANYEIGYGRPPKRYRFKPGQIANPEGINRKRARSPNFVAGARTHKTNQNQAGQTKARRHARGSRHQHAGSSIRQRRPAGSA